MPQTLGPTKQQIRDIFASRLLNHTPAADRIDQERFVKLSETDVFPRILIYILPTHAQNDMKDAYGAPFEGSQAVQIKLEYHVDANDTASLVAAVDMCQTMIAVLLCDKTFMTAFQSVASVDTRMGTDDTSARFRAAAHVVFTVTTEIGYGFA